MRSVDHAKDLGANGFCKDDYSQSVKVYSISDFFRGICDGPHIGESGMLGAVPGYQGRIKWCGCTPCEALLA